MRISWRAAARVAATAAMAVLALALAPSLLRAPEPPPLDPDIGLNGLADAAPMPTPRRTDRGREVRGAPSRKAEEEAGVRDQNRQEPKRDRSEGTEPERDPEPKPRPTPPAPPTPTLAPAPPPPPSVPVTPAPTAPPTTPSPPPGIRQFGP